MIRALKAAFLLRYPVPGLGSVPINLVGLACLGLMGVGNPGFWFAGLGLETVYLATLASNGRFQRFAEGMARVEQGSDVESRRTALLAQLTDADKLAMERLSERCRRIESLWQSQDDFALHSNEEALRDLQWTYLKLLIARQHLVGSEREADEKTVRADITALEQAVLNPQLSPGLRQSKSATLSLLKRRAENVERRRQTLDEIASDLSRIEAQIALLLENATLEGKPQAVSADIDLASRLLDGSVFGSSADDIAALDAAYARVPQAQRVTES
jgi:hypothetical protein